MKSFLSTLLLIAFFGISEARAQNLTQMIENSPKESAYDEIADIEDSIVKIEVIGLRGHLFNAVNRPKVPKNALDRAAEIVQNANYQRQRFNETGQPIEIDRDHIYYRRDAYSYTKGIVLCEFFNGRVDIGIYKKHFAPATTLISGKMGQDFGAPESNALLYRNGNRIFFSLRVKFPAK